MFLDEPTFGQDPQSWRDVVSVLDDYLSSGGSIVVATHDNELVRALADNVIELGGST
jgi:energy-coupling factor transport system ATP-binding protein